MSKLIERARWKVANLLNRLPGTCWTHLVTWSMGDGTVRDPGLKQDSICRRDAAANGSCYCGKLAGDLSTEEWLRGDPNHLPPGLAKVGTGWTRTGALRSLARRIDEREGS